MHSRHRLLLCTCPDPETAQALAERLVDERLAACVNILPGIRSVYRWEDAVQQDSETLLLVKTGAERVSELIERLRELHPYEVPEIIALPITEGLSDYLSWVDACTSS
ncbi:divalent-cation tolerance protein CutA [Imhoffiella purpurea]|uniref:Periplasmic divalent cation tolerance protein CutA n=1 Tax=Imhoffiella purpurea TaxID=1249627 RepID=W9VAM5_9GAMM|nr:divalent-cation tolerance protein CutA [Imhoffiella purpurea]EXJ16663.1 Periplasmic divalent cation tolerance protein CutA [Imhoffiella purpurea]